MALERPDSTDADYRAQSAPGRVTASTGAELVERVIAVAGAGIRELIDFHKAFCCHCGVKLYGKGDVVVGAGGVMIGICPGGECPVGVNFTTIYPAGLEVMVVSGFATGMVATIEDVSDAYPRDHTGRAYYGGRSYVLTLGSYGRRPMSETILRPTDESLIGRFTVARP